MNGNEKPHQDDVMNVKEAARFLKISEAKLRRLITKRAIPFFRIDGRILFYRLSLDEWIQKLLILPTDQEQDEDVASKIWNKHSKG